MDAWTVNNSPPAATHDGAVRCLMAIELSKKRWIVAVNTPLSDKISNYAVKGWQELLELIDKIRFRVGQRGQASRPLTPRTERIALAGAQLRDLTQSEAHITSTTIGAAILLCRSAATKVVVFHVPRGTWPITLMPRGALPLSRAKIGADCQPNNIPHTNRHS